MFWQKKTVGQELIGQFNKEAKSIRKTDMIRAEEAAVDKLCADFPVLLRNADTNTTRQALVDGMVKVILELGEISDTQHVNSINARVGEIDKLSSTLLSSVGPGDSLKSFPQRLNLAALKLRDDAESCPPLVAEALLSVAKTFSDTAVKAGGTSAPANTQRATYKAPAQ